MHDEIESKVIPYKNLFFNNDETFDPTYTCPKCGHEDKNVLAETEVYFGGAMRWTTHKCIKCGEELE